MKFRHLLLATIVSTISLGSFSVVDTESVVLELQYPQILSISAPTNNDVISSSSISVRTTRTTSWEIKSNNAVEVHFSGSTPTDLDEGVSLPDVPRFYKQEVNARGELVTGKYDYLTTNFAATIVNYENTLSGGNTWMLGNDPNAVDDYIYGRPEDLVLNDTGPAGEWGLIMPGDDGSFTLNLYSQGVVTSSSAVNTQSGVYTMTVFFNVSANEQL